MDAEREYGKVARGIFTKEGAQIEELCTLRDDDHLYIFFKERGPIRL